MQMLHESGSAPVFAMPSDSWLIQFVPRQTRHCPPPRWLSESGCFTCRRSEALAFVTAEAAAERIQSFVEIQGWRWASLERFKLVLAMGN